MEQQPEHILKAIWCFRGHIHPIDFYPNDPIRVHVRPVFLDPEYIVAVDMVNWICDSCSFEKESSGIYNYNLANYPPNSMKILRMSRNEVQPSPSDKRLTEKEALTKKIINEVLKRLKTLDGSSDSAEQVQEVQSQEAYSVEHIRPRKKEMRKLRFLKEKHLEEKNLRIEWYGGSWDYFKEASWLTIGEVKLFDVTFESPRGKDYEYHVYYTPEHANNIASFSSIPKAQQHRIKHLPTRNVGETFPYVSEYLIQTPYGDHEFISCKRWAQLDVKLGPQIWKNVFFVVTEKWNDKVILGRHFGCDNINFYINGEKSEKSRVYFRNEGIDIPPSSRFERLVEPERAKELINVDCFRSFCNDTAQF